MNVLLVEPYYTGSHKYWADNISKYSRHTIKILSLPGRHWKWRMKGASLYLAPVANDLDFRPDIIVCSTMMDLASFRSLLIPELRNVPLVYYMHENQLTYPENPQDIRKGEAFHYGFINMISCTVADKVIFNSHYHQKSFQDAALKLLARLPDYNQLELLTSRIDESLVVGVGLDIEMILNILERNEKIVESHFPTLVWNHRRSFDKDPELFWKLCHFLERKNMDFNLCLLGKADNVGDFDQQSLKFKNRIIHNGMTDSYEDYLMLLSQGHILPVSSKHDFYGLSFLEALVVGLYPIVPRGMVYEEFLDPDINRHLFYNDVEDFFNRTIDAIINYESTPKPNFDNKIFDLKTTIYHLDNSLEDFI